ncbi:hypothetical protein [Virgibacillus halodenitrificans]|uniref:hypothetical protein n=1 Tax=Virgibacillus halodenitrificans TaxID=1482 RepID=UPI002DC048EA|nr:hypothetical protein [Virgibacillus halodenitrificans]MEC2159078.1 hypothetical protein [Virgibacillus halodenitrificans]
MGSTYVLLSFLKWPFVGRENDFIYYLFLFIGAIICYSIIKPFIHMALKLQARKLLNYILSSLIIVILIMFSTSYLNLPTVSATDLLKIGLQCLAGFGALLLCLHSIRFWKEKL